MSIQDGQDYGNRKTFHRTGPDLEALMAQGDNDAPSASQTFSTPNGDVTYRSGGSVARAQGGATDPIAAGITARQANFDSTLGRQIEQLQDKIENRWTHDVIVQHEDGSQSVERQIKPGFETEVRKAQMTIEQHLVSSQFQAVMADRRLAEDQAALARKGAELSAGAMAVDEANAKSWAETGVPAVSQRSGNRHRAGLTIGGRHK